LIAKKIFDNILGKRDRIGRLRCVHVFPERRLAPG
jgi:hypothetical protein